MRCSIRQASWHSSRAFGRALELPLLASIARVLAVVLSVYLWIRFLDMFHRGVLPLLSRNRTETWLFLLETEYGLAMKRAEADWVRTLIGELADGTFPDLKFWRSFTETGEFPEELLGTEWAQAELAVLAPREAPHARPSQLRRRLPR